MREYENLQENERWIPLVLKSRPFESKTYALALTSHIPYIMHMKSI
jgi:hypothetical protein